MGSRRTETSKRGKAGNLEGAPRGVTAVNPPQLEFAPSNYVDQTSQNKSTKGTLSRAPRESSEKSISRPCQKRSLICADRGGQTKGKRRQSCRMKHFYSSQVLSASSPFSWSGCQPAEAAVESVSASQRWCGIMHSETTSRGERGERSPTDQSQPKHFHTLHLRHKTYPGCYSSSTQCSPPPPAQMLQRSEDGSRTDVGRQTKITARCTAETSPPSM